MNWRINLLTKQLVCAAATSLALVAAGGSAGAVELIVNGGFEQSSSGFTTPPGWTNIGHIDGVVTYSAVSVFNLPAYEGLNFYSIGGPGSNGHSSPGEGISQTVATTIGNTYRLTVGLTDENGPGLESVLNVGIGSQLNQVTLNADSSGFFGRPFETYTFDYVATSSLTTISFTLFSSTDNGNNDPLIDGVSFQQIAIAEAVPEPSTWAMIIAGFAGVGFMGYRRQRKAAAVA
jgi:hypothetical protein